MKQLGLPWSGKDYQNITDMYLSRTTLHLHHMITHYFHPYVRHIIVTYMYVRQSINHHKCLSSSSHMLDNLPVSETQFEGRFLGHLLNKLLVSRA